jgi:periplasmic protein TonB
MEANKILTANVLDIIFDGKNKDYGAYQLRSCYKKRLTKALLITGSTLLLFLGGTVLANILNNDINRNNLNTVETILVQVHNEEIAPPPPPPPPPPKQQQPDFKQVVFTPPIIVEDEAVKPDEIIREIESDVAISNKNVDSDNTQPVINAPVDETNTKVVEVKKPDEEGKIFTAVEIEAGFPGGEDAWRSYLRNTLNAGTPIDNGAGGGKYTVIVKFVVSKDGSVSDIKCENDPGFGMCDEAVRVIKKTKNWTPAIQNGQYVNAYRRQPITFLVEE